MLHLIDFLHHIQSFPILLAGRQRIFTRKTPSEMATPPLWLSGQEECQDFSDDCHKVLQISSAVSFQAARSIQTVCEGAVFLTCIAWKPWFWGLGGNEDGFQHHRSSLGTRQDTQQKFPSLPFMNPTVPTTGHASSPEHWGRNGLSIQLCCSSSLSAWATWSHTA